MFMEMTDHMSESIRTVRRRYFCKWSERIYETIFVQRVTLTTRPKCLGRRKLAGPSRITSDCYDPHGRYLYKGKHSVNRRDSRAPAAYTYQTSRVKCFRLFSRQKKNCLNVFAHRAHDMPDEQSLILYL